MTDAAFGMAENICSQLGFIGFLVGDSNETYISDYGSGKLTEIYRRALTAELQVGF